MKPFKKTGEQLVYDGYRKVLHRSFELPDGQQHGFDVVLAGGAVAILAMTARLEVVTFEQFRPGPERVLRELPGGGPEKDETPQQAVERELLEETGYAADVEYLGPYWRDAYTTGQWHMFVGRNANKVSEPHLDGTEFGRTVLVPLDEFKVQLQQGLLTDTTLGWAGLYYLGLL